MSAANNSIQSRVRGRGQKGTALLEFAFVVPVLLSDRDGHHRLRNCPQQLSCSLRKRRRTRRSVSGDSSEGKPRTLAAIRSTAVKLAATNLNAANLTFKLVLNGTVVQTT